MTTVEGERHFDAPPERVFEALVDPDVVAGALPAVRSHRAIDTDHWEAKIKLHFPFAPAVTIRFEVVEKRPPQHASLVSHGAGAHVQTSFDLEPDDDGGTHMHWRAQVELTGLLAPFAGHGLEPLARRQAERVLEHVDEAAAR